MTSSDKAEVCTYGSYYRLCLKKKKETKGKEKVEGKKSEIDSAYFAKMSVTCERCC